jgi:protein-tyrosine phosphatase
MLEGEELMKSDPTFSLWRDFLDDGGLVVVSPYVKYKGGVSPRDVIALFLAVRPILLHNPKREFDIRSWEYFSGRSDWMHNLLVIGSEVANQMTEFIRGKHLSLVTDFSLEIRKNCLIDTLREEREEKLNCLVPIFEGEPRVHNTEVDYALITRACNPFAPDKKIVILAGIKGYGTITAALAFSEQQYWSKIDQRVDMLLGRLQLDEDKARNALIEIVIRAKTPKRPQRRGPAIPSYTPRWPATISIELVKVSYADLCDKWVHEGLTWVPQDAIPSLPPPEKPVSVDLDTKDTEIRSPGEPSKEPLEPRQSDINPWKFLIGLGCSLAAMAIVVLILVFAAKQVPSEFPIIAGPAVIVLIVILGFVMTWMDIIDTDTLTKLISLVTRPSKQ